MGTVQQGRQQGRKDSTGCKKGAGAKPRGLLKHRHTFATPSVIHYTNHTPHTPHTAKGKDEHRERKDKQRKVFLTWRHSAASVHTRTTASTSSPFTWKMGALIDLATSVQYGEERPVYKVEKRIMVDILRASCLSKCMD